MFREMIPLILLFLKTALSGAQAVDNTQPSQLPDGKICLFTCSEWIFEEKVQQFAPSADLLGPGYLSKHKIGFSNDDANSQNTNDSPMQYQKVWGAVYSIEKNEYDAVLKQSQNEYSVPFASNEDVFVVKYNEMNCLVVDLGIQPGDYPPWRHFNMKIPNSLEDEMYFNRLAQIGVPPEYIKGLRNASKKPPYHPIIPQDYHPREIGQQPKRTFDQLPTVRVHPNPHQPDDQLITGQIPELHDSEIPGLSLPSAPVHTVQPTTHHFLPGVPNPNSQPQVITDEPEYVRGTPLMNVQPNPHDVQVTVPEGLDSGVATTPDHKPVVVITPMKLPGSSTTKPVVAKPINTVQNQSPILVPGKADNSNVVLPSNGPILTTHQPKEIDDTVPTIVTGVAHPPLSNTINPTLTGTSQPPLDDQAYVVITPLKLPLNNDNLASAPVVGQDYKVQTPLSVQPDDTQQTLIPKTIGDDATNPKNVPPMLFSGPTQQTKVGPVVTRQPTGSLLTPDVTAPPRLQTQSPDLLINPSLQPGVDHTLEPLPTSYNLPCDQEIPGSNSGLLTLSPHPDVITHQNDSPLLTLNDVPQTDQSTIPVLHPDQTGSIMTPGVVNNKPIQQVNGPSVIPDQSYGKPATLDVGNSPDVLLTNTAPNHLQLHPDVNVNHPVHEIPTTFNVPKATPIIPQKPMFGFDQCNQPNDISHIPTSSNDQPTTVSHQIIPNNQPTTVSHQIIPSTIDLDNNPHQITPNTVNSDDNPDLLLTNTAPNHLQLHPTGDQSVHQIPTSFGVSKPPPFVSDKPMFTIDHPNCPDHPTTSYQVNPNTLDHFDNPDLLLPNTANPDRLLPSTLPNSVQLQPTDNNPDLLLPNTANPGLLHPSTAPNHIQLQPTGDNPDLLLPNTAPNHLQPHPTVVQPAHPIPCQFGVEKPAGVLPNKPMFGYDQSNPPSSTIPATFGISSHPPAVEDTPMFSLHGSPSVLQPKHIDDNSYIPASTVTPINTVDQPHATGLLPNLVHDQDTQPGHLVSQPSNVPLTTNSIPDSTVHQLPNHVDDSHPILLNPNPAVLTSQPDKMPLTTIPDSHTVQVPNQIVSHDQPNQLVSKPSLIGATNIPALTTASPAMSQSQPVNTASPVQTPKVSPQPVQQVPPSTYTPSTFMAPNYLPSSPVLGYTFAYRYPQFLHNSNYKPPNCFYSPDELIPGFTFGSHIQLY